MPPVVLLLAALPAPAIAQEPGAGLVVQRTEEAIRVDGRLDEAAWQEALVLGDFRRVEPPPDGVPADPQTEVRLLRDDRRLYIGITAWEPEPDRLVLQQRRRDAFLRDDDRVEFFLDTFRDGRTAYWFQISAAGSRGDALLADNGERFNKRWDAWWEARTRIEADRWTVEIAIPFQAIAFGESGVWRMNFKRYRGADRTESRWAAARREIRFFTVAEGVDVGGFQGLEQGLGLEFLPYVKFKSAGPAGQEDSDLFATGGGEISWRITPQLTGSLTVNTDFAETEADERRVNLTRFPLFYPEKRDFFLEDSNLFEFGRISGFRGGGNHLLPYFSRRIGLSPRGAEVPLEAGLRLAGRIENLDLGLLAVRTGAVSGEGIPPGELFVARPSLRLSQEWAAGGLVTQGNPVSREQNLVTGLDFRFNSTNFLPGTFGWNTWWVRSEDQTIDDIGYAWGTQAALLLRNWSFGVDVLASQRAFQPALGFVRRPGERRFAGEIRYEPRPGKESSVRKYIFGARPEVWTDLSGELQSYGSRVTLFALEWHDGDRFSVVWVPAGDRPPRTFSLVPGSVIQAGAYDWHTLRSEYQFSTARPVSGRVSIEAGSWYDGSIQRYSGQVAWRPSGFLQSSLSFRQDHAFLPGGDFISRIGIFNLDLSFSPDLTLENLVQVDNVSDVLGLQSRLRWILEDGREVFVVVDYAWQEVPGGVVVPLDRDLTVKAVFALRF